MGPVGAERGLVVIGVWTVAFVLASILSRTARVDINQ